MKHLEIEHEWKLIYLIWGSLAFAFLFSLWEQDWPSLFVTVVTFGLTTLPILLPKKFDIHLPLSFIASIIVFIYATIFLGEFADFYERFWWWDIPLHMLSAFGFGLLGVVFVLILLRRDRIKANSFLLSVFAFSFALSIGALWEIFEFLMDVFFGLNMQKSGLIDTMWDLIIDTVGAAFASFIGYVYMRTDKNQGIAAEIKEAVEENIA